MARSTNKFYQEYKTFFQKVQREIKRNNPQIPQFEDKIELHQFTQRFLRRIMVLYFIQKKGWLASDYNFLKSHYDNMVKKGGNYYADFLENVFFEVLSSERENDESPWGNIPFLNGGLFKKEKEYPTDFTLPNSFFDPQSDEGLLGFFNNYNFTIEEDTPLDMKVALDPEMLGKVFETLLEEEERKQTGTYYTPRPIVHFICQTSLIEHLHDKTGISKDLLKILFTAIPPEGSLTEEDKLTPKEAKVIHEELLNIKILDPAVGSGAFLIAMLQNLVIAKRRCMGIMGKQITRGTMDYTQMKIDFIKKSLYGVDIKTEAIKIAKLRLLLSLVVDMEREHLQSLPNLDYNLMVGDSLIENGEDKPSFSYKLHFGDVFDSQGGFDIVLGNPPYEGKPSGDYKKYLQSIYSKKYKQTYYAQADLAQFFVFRAFELVRKGGYISYIMSDTFFTNRNKRDIREILLQNKLIHIVKTSPSTFAASIEPAIFLVKKETIADNLLLFINFENVNIAKIDLIDIPYKLQKDSNLDIIKRSEMEFEGELGQLYLLSRRYYLNSINKTIFEPKSEIVEFYSRYMNDWQGIYAKFNKILARSTEKGSLNEEIRAYLNSLKENDLTLFGLVFKGGKGMDVSGGNASAIGVIEGTDQAEIIRIQGHIGRSRLTKIIEQAKIADISKLTEEEKEKGINPEKPYYVLVSMGGDIKTRYYKPIERVIDWSENAIKQYGSKRNSQYFFKEGVSVKMGGGVRNLVSWHCTPAVLTSVNQIFIPLTPKVTINYCLGLLNSTFIQHIKNSFLNRIGLSTENMRHIPIIIPTKEDLHEIDKNVEELKKIQQKRYEIKDYSFQSDLFKQLSSEIDDIIKKIYLS